MKFTIDSESYDFDDSRLSVAEGRIVKERTGLGVASFSAGLRDGDPDALLALVFLAKKRAGEAVKWAELEDADLNLVDLLVQLIRDSAERIAADDTDDDEEPKGDADEKSDPTPPAAKTRGKTPKPE